MHKLCTMGLFFYIESKSVKIIAYQVCYLHYLVHMCAQFNGPITMYIVCYKYYTCTSTMKMNANIATLIL